MRRSRVWVSWSCGKDSAFALQGLRARDDVEVAGLLTTVEAETGVVTASRVPGDLLARQAAELDLPVRTVELPWPCPNDVYERQTAEALAGIRGDGGDEVVFGDLFLADVRAYRERLLAGSGLRAGFPLWGTPTDELARRMQDSGLRAVVVCVDPRQAPAGILGRPWDAELLGELPAAVDPCGENGEFHTFVTGGAGLARDIAVVGGGTVERDGFLHAPLRERGTG